MLVTTTPTCRLSLRVLVTLSTSDFASLVRKAPQIPGESERAMGVRAPLPSTTERIAAVDRRNRECVAGPLRHFITYQRQYRHPGFRSQAGPEFD